MDQIKIGKFIAKKRKSEGFTQSQLAELLGVSTGAVSKWERGLCMMDSSLMIPLCEKLKISADELLMGEVLEYSERQTNKEILKQLDAAKEERDANVLNFKRLYVLIERISAFLGIAAYLALGLSVLILAEPDTPISPVDVMVLVSMGAFFLSTALAICLKMEKSLKALASKA